MNGRERLDTHTCVCMYAYCQYTSMQILSGKLKNKNPQENLTIFMAKLRSYDFAIFHFPFDFSHTHTHVQSHTTLCARLFALWGTAWRTQQNKKRRNFLATWLPCPVLSGPEAEAATANFWPRLCFQLQMHCVKCTSICTYKCMCFACMYVCVCVCVLGLAACGCALALDNQLIGGFGNCNWKRINCYTTAIRLWYVCSQTLLAHIGIKWTRRNCYTTVIRLLYVCS